MARALYTKVQYATDSLSHRVAFGGLELDPAGSIKSDLLVLNATELQHHVRLPLKHLTKKKKLGLYGSEERQKVDDTRLPKQKVPEMLAHSTGCERRP